MSHVVVMITVEDDNGGMREIKRVSLDEIRLPKGEEDVLDQLEGRAEAIGREVTQTVFEVEWEEVDAQAVEERRGDFSPWAPGG